MIFGREVPRANGIELAFWACSLFSSLVVLALAGFYLTPDARGIGTHEQLKLPPCGFVQAFDGPCPSCGFTTTFTLAAHGRPLDALINQPFGFALFCLTLLGVPVTALALYRRASLFSLTDRWPWGTIVIATLLLWLLAWAYKWHWG